mgnify:CR=1 FL=1
MASTPSDSWFYVVGQQPIGPVSLEQLRAAVSAGTVGPQTLVRNAGWTHWFQAVKVPGLCSAEAAAPPEASPNEGAPKGDGTQSKEVAGRVRVAAPGDLKSPGHGSSSIRIAAPTGSVQVAAPPAAPTAVETQPEEFNVQEIWGDGAPSPVLRRKKGLPVVSLLALVLALGAGGALVYGIVNYSSIGTPSPVEPDTPRHTPVPLKRPADVAKKTEDAGPEKPKEEEPTDFRMSDFDLRPRANPAIFEIPGPPKPKNRIDEITFAKWKELGIEPASPCTDAVFFRRVYLDVIGTLPTVEEARAFYSDTSPDKRAKLIEALLKRPEFAEFWAMKWCDLLRVKAEFPINLWPNAAQAYHRWVRNAIRDNMPYDKFVRELLTASGSNFRVPQVNFYRALQSKDPKGIARAVALTFMGSRAEKWPEERLTGLSGFFFKVGYKKTGEWKEEIVFFDPEKVHYPPPPSAPPAGAKPGEKAKKRVVEKKAPAKKPEPIPPPPPVFPDGTPAQIPPNTDPRVVFADWLITPKNPWFARTVVNRIWCWLQGRGIVHEPDDFRPDNPPSNPELLDYLAEELVKANYDLKHIYRLILNSSTYQLSSIPKSKHPQAAAQFAFYTVRRLEAEVIIDALNQITGTTESYSSIIPEPYTFIPETRRAISLPDGSITSSFLELFGRPPRDTGLESERNNRITAGQRLHLLNSSHIRNKLRDGPALRKLLTSGNATEDLYLAILSRFPDEQEVATGDDLAWTLINSTEFLFRH